MLQPQLYRRYWEHVSSTGGTGNTSALQEVLGTPQLYRRYWEHVSPTGGTGNTSALQEVLGTRQLYRRYWEHVSSTGWQLYRRYWALQVVNTRTLFNAYLWTSPWYRQVYMQFGHQFPLSSVPSLQCPSVWPFGKE